MVVEQARLRRATIIDVAREAGVSRTTASDALRGTGRVSEATRAHVARVASELAYRPNSAARSLRAAATGTLGLHVPEHVTRISYYVQVIFGVLEECAEEGYDITLINTRRMQPLDAAPRVDGVILVDPMVGDEVVHDLLALDVPTVTMERLVGDEPRAALVVSDHDASTRALLDHLVDRGCRRVGLLASPPVTDWGTRVLASYRAWCDAHDVEPALRTMPFAADRETYLVAARELVSTPGVDGLVCGPVRAIEAVLQVARDAGRVVGRDLLVAGGVDDEALEHSDPPVTAVDLDPRGAGAECVRLLLQVLRKETEPTTEVTFPVSVRFRESTAGPVSR